MTRQKKEIIKRIVDIQMWIDTDVERGCGFAPADFYAPLYKQIHELEEELARLRHFNSVEEMYYNDFGPQEQRSLNDELCLCN